MIAPNINPVKGTCWDIEPRAFVIAIQGFIVLTSSMRKINKADIVEHAWASPKGKFAGASKELSEALGRDPASMDLRLRHPFDVEICRIPAGKTPYPYHSHSAQWEFYLILSGSAKVRDKEGVTAVSEGDAFIFEPDQPHQILNDSEADLVILVVADNPVGESCHYPDSQKWLVRSPDRKLIGGQGLNYYDGEE